MWRRQGTVPFHATNSIVKKKKKSELELALPTVKVI
jgi:hypothetical protein